MERIELKFSWSIEIKGGKQLLLFLQSKTTDVYVNVLTHCINNENVEDVYFAINEGDSAALLNAREQIRVIMERLDELKKETSQSPENFHQQYQRTSICLSDFYFAERKRVIKILFAKPDLSVKKVKKLFLNSKELVIDISSCNKKVSTDVISCFMSSGIKGIRYFELDSRAYSNNPQDRIYHKICGEGLPYYDYIDFSEPGNSTLSSFNKMRFQGNVIKTLLFSVFLLALAIIVLIQQQRTSLAQLASILISVATVVSLILGILNSGFDVFDRLKRT
ncbi:MAG: hypothetical protein F6K42_16165 [Leptolyngbya sp. SIO1D8]|nr:hypothetical protein [Leptolyngbya sp. SIO1D8]